MLYLVLKMKSQLSILFFFALISASAQNVELMNPSFEGEPHKGKKSWYVVDGWEDCGFENETGPDVHPGLKDGKPFHAVTKQAFDDSTYIGMVTRDDETWEAIGQSLGGQKLKSGATYAFSIYLARSINYISRSKLTGAQVNYDQPLVLRIWGSNAHNERGELLAESKRINHFDWKEYDFLLRPTSDWTWFILEVFYARPIDYMVNGNMLLDKCSALVECRP